MKSLVLQKTHLASYVISSKGAFVKLSKLLVPLQKIGNFILLGHAKCSLY